MLKKLFNIMETVVVVSISIFAAILFLLKFSGYNSFSVLSASMTPNYKVGDLVYAKQEEFSNINIGDVIVYNAKGGNVRVMHRVVEKDTEKKEFYTKGDANISMDSNPVLFEQVIGKVNLIIPKMGLIGMYFSTFKGKIVALILITLLILLFIMPDIFIKKNSKK